MSYNKNIWETGDIITKEKLNNMENGIESAHQNFDTVIKNDIKTIKTDLGTETLNTTAKDVKGAVNEVNAQYKDIANKVNVSENGISIDAVNLLCNILKTCVTNGDQLSNIELLKKALTTYNSKQLNVSYNGTTAIISNLASVNVSYSGTTAIIG